MVNVIWATGTRTGSQFLVTLTLKALGNMKRSSLTPGRRDNMNSDLKPSFQDYAKQGKRADYFIDHGIEAVKIEHCGEDLLLFDLMERFPSAKVLTVLRPIHQIVDSHQKILEASKKTSNAPLNITREKAISRWMSDLVQLEYVKNLGRLFAIELHGKENFDKAKFLAFLEAKSSNRFDKFLESWPVVNDLSHRLRKFKTAGDDGKDGDAKNTRDVEFPIVASVEARYRKLLENQPA